MVFHFVPANSTQRVKCSLWSFVKHPQQGTCSAGRAALALLPVANRLVRHVDAPCQLHLTEPQPPPNPARVTRHVLQSLGIVFLLLPDDLGLGSPVYHRRIKSPLRGSLPDCLDQS